jgi:hypothetical protein
MNSVGWLGMAFEAGSFSARAKERRMQTQQPIVRPRGALFPGLSHVRRASEFNRTPAAPTSVARDFAALRSACDALTSACGVRLWRLARQIADFAANHHMSGSEMARGLGRSRGYVSRALKAARLPEPVTDEDAQQVFDVFHGVSGAARAIKDAAAALRLSCIWARAAVKRGASPDAVKLEVDQAIARLPHPEQPSARVSIRRNTSRGSDRVSIRRNIGRFSSMGGLAIWMTAAVCGWAAQAAAQCQYEATVLPPVGCFGGPGTPVAINNLGDVLLTRHDCGEPILHASFIWSSESGLLPIHPPPGFHGAQVEDVNDLREIVGIAEQQISGPKGTITIQQACLWRPGETILLGIPTGGNFSIANAINNRSEICGYWGNSATGQPGLRAFIWREGVMSDLNLPVGPNSEAEDINDHSQITGWMGGSDVVGARAFVWSERTTVNLGVIPGGITGTGVAIGDNGMVSGRGVVPTKADPFRRESVQWQGTVAVNCGLLPFAERMVALGGNDFATVGVCDRPSELGNRGFLYQSAVLSDLSLFLDGADRTATSATIAK